MKISKAGLDLIRSFEGFVPYVYDDLRPPVNGKYREWKGETVKGTLTIGIGHTDAAKHPLKCTLGLKVTEDQACEILDVDLDEVEDDVNRLVKVPLTQGQYDACCSLVYNIGAGNFSRSSILKKLNKGDYNGARAAFDLYVKSKGVTLWGLQRRRDAEQALFDSDVAEPISEQGVDHPAEVEAAKEPMGAPTAGSAGAAVGAVSGATAAVQLSTASVVPAPPQAVTEAVSNAENWRTLGETVSGLTTLASSKPLLAAAVVTAIVGFVFGPLLKPYLPKITWGSS